VLAVDADMIIKPSNKFKNFKLTENGYKIIQKHGNIVYYNIRFMKCSYDWKCIGATHEYWSGDPTAKIEQDVIYIDDISDGGCKSDKAERDIRLLTQDIDNGKNLDRSHFYLAQTLKETGKYEAAIEKYKKRIELGGWVEEVWYSHYQIGKCYYEFKKYTDMEYWMNAAFDYHSNRSEPFYFLTYHYRMVSQHYKAYHYYLRGKNIPFPKDELLFIEHNIYNGLFDYESTVLSCYMCHKRQDALCELISYINKKIQYIR
jgi:tetratricopeptide (TPR) repeat protein